MDWFERLMGFSENDRASIHARIEVSGNRLRSTANGKSYGIGTLELVSLQSLRDRVANGASCSGNLRLGIVSGDVRKLHRQPEYSNALFQVASQFNLLEMVSPDVSPDDGVTRYQYDHTQGPACAIAAGAATIYRNYYVPLNGQTGQTAERQIDALIDLGHALADVLGTSIHSLWTMRNGYALCSQHGLEEISAYLKSAMPKQIDALRCLLRIGLHHDVEVTDGNGSVRPLVSQAFCSALPVAYSRVAAEFWRPFAILVLEAAYEATLLAGVANAQCGKSNIVLLTRLGGGAFGNADEWIDAAIYRALDLVRGFDLDVRIVSYGPPSLSLRNMVDRCNV
jgi:hypothetical protein